MKRLLQQAMQIFCLVLASVIALMAQEPVVYYPFSGNTKDVSANSNDAAVQAARLTADRFNFANSAFQFDGRSSFLRAANLEALNTPATTISFWVRVDSLPAQGEAFLMSHGGWQERWKISLPGHGKPVFTTNYANGISDMDSGDGNELSVGTWHHVAFVHDGSQNLIYLNGTQVASKNVPGALNSTTHPLGMGYNPIDNANFFKGALDEVMIFGEALSAAQIADLYQDQSTNPMLSDRLVASYSFSGNALDGSDFNNHGTAENTSSTTDRHGFGRQAISFNGNNSKVTAANSAQLNSVHTTVSFWVKLNSLPPQGEYFLLSHGGWQERWKISLPAHGKPVWTTNGSTGISDMDSGDGNELKVGEWTHVAMVHDGANDKIFINGELVASKGVAGTLNPTVRPLGIGYNPIDGGAYLDGAFDEIQIFNYAVSDEDIKTLYIEQSTSNVQTDLVANFAFAGDHNDSSPFGNHASGGSSATDRFGYASNAIHFNGEAGADVANSIQYNSPETSIAFWVKMDELPAQGEVFLLSHGGWQQRWKISLPGHGKPVFTTNYENGISDMDSGDGNALVPGVWSHLVMVHDGATNKIYLNGQLAAEKAVVGALNSTIHRFGLGYNPVDGGNYMNGSLDEVRLYNRALSAEEIAELYAEQSKEPEYETDLVANYPFSGHAEDVTVFRNTAKVQGAQLTQDRFRKANQAYSFNGGSSEVIADNSPQLNSDYTTVSFWVRVRELPAQGEVFLFSHGGWQERWKISLPGHGKPVWTTNNSSGISDMDSGDGNDLKPGEWTHVVMVHDGELDRIHFNGVRVAQKNVSGTMNRTERPFGMGYNPIDGGLWFDGDLDEVRIYNRALTDEEIAALYDEQSEEPDPDDTEAPTTPLNLSASVNFTTIHLNWLASTDNEGVTGYNVYRDGQKVATTSDTEITFSGLPQLTEFLFGVSAVDGAGNESLTATLPVRSGEDESPDTTPPTMPGDLRAETGSYSVLLVWEPSIDDRGVVGYVILVDGIRVDTIPGDRTSYLVTGLNPEEWYTFEVYAFDAAGNDSEWAEITVRTEPELDTGEPGLVAHYPFEDNANDATPYNNHGEIFGNPIFENVANRPNAAGKAIKFHGMGDHVLAPNAVQLISDFTSVSFWIRVDGRNFADAEAYILNFGDWSQRWKISLPQHLKVVWTTNSKNQMFDNAISDMDSGDGNELSETFWWYVTMVHDGQDDIIYVDGEVANTKTAPGTLNPTARPLSMAYNPQTEGQFFIGALDELKIYNRALTPEEVESLYATGTVSTDDFLTGDLRSVIQSVYPNPVGDQLFLEHSLRNNHPLVIRVMDMQGRQIDQIRWEANAYAEGKIELNTAKYNAGVYMINFVYGGRNLGAYKIIKK